MTHILLMDPVGIAGLSDVGDVEASGRSQPHVPVACVGQEGIETVIFDAHSCVMDGSTGFLPRRLMVLDEDYPCALALLRVAMPEQLSAEQLASGQSL